MNPLALGACLEPLPGPDALRQLWEQGAGAAGASFFTSWTWIESWLSSLRTKGAYRLLRVSRGDAVVALGIVVLATVRRSHRLTRRVVHLHATGDPECDSVHIEQNDLLLAEPATPEIYDTAVRCLMQWSEQWDEIDLQGVAHEACWAAAAQRAGLLVDIERHASPRILLSKLPPGQPLWKSLRPKKARYELRRSLNDYSSQLGPLRVDEPTSVAEALTFLSGLTRLHERRWKALGICSPFIEPRATVFHGHLVSAGFATRRARICRVTAGDATVGYVYLLIHEGVANFYQSGFDYQLLKRHNQPGWLCLQLVIEMMRAEGLEVFEFLAGEQHYKQRLANDVVNRSWIRLTRPLWRFRLERMLVAGIRSIRNGHRRALGGVGSAS